MTILRDPITGTGVRVTKDGEQLSLSITSKEIEFISHEKGLAFSLHSSYSATGGEEIISLENNNSDLDILVEDIIVSTSASGLFSLFVCNAGLTPGGTGITSLNLNLGSSVVAQAIGFGNNSVTGSLAGSVIDEQDIGTTTPYHFQFGDSLIMTKGKQIAITAATTGVVHATIIYYFASRIEFD